jgi:hypothetical protein
VRGLEFYELGNDDGGTDLIVNVTEVENLDEVKIYLSRHWTWGSQHGPEVLIDEDGELSEWLTLRAAEKLPESKVA